MNVTTVGFLFFLSLVFGAGAGCLFNHMKVGASIGLAVGMLIVVLFRIKRW
ncbi:MULTISPECIES: hypothetical protein [Virgibacillus]|uniref:hypothetical protein n=1 Tax=Virgibacillus TaxID=84406 RepID=UPI000955BB01|nr:MULTISPECIES: hypothetical protein [Virgibacillus]MBS7428301.1 hypothetical protein [Virgibacillus sp. 19R1-5]MBU8565266.1 hypothetical protein [Virgibacillus pantothenticus]MBU8599515.1 hypothetical protein [Virgibacillus pantothenticus]MBU8633585.1 hypothetical protein [Virgibacillus pantothenticus]MBU8641795.1 hypothetical protein [Virgibacillus pantothenticus]